MKVLFCLDDGEGEENTGRQGSGNTPGVSIFTVNYFSMTNRARLDDNDRNQLAMDRADRRGKMTNNGVLTK